MADINTVLNDETWVERSLPLTARAIGSAWNS